VPRVGRHDWCHVSVHPSHCWRLMLAYGPCGHAEYWCFRDERWRRYWCCGFLPWFPSGDHVNHHVQSGPVHLLEVQPNSPRQLLGETSSNTVDVSFSYHDELPTYGHSRCWQLEDDLLSVCRSWSRRKLYQHWPINAALAKCNECRWKPGDATMPRKWKLVLG